MGNKFPAQCRTVETEIVVDSQHSLLLNEMLIFPHGFDGLHLWEAGIILARWVFYHREIFAGKSVLELGTGVGIGGLAVCQFSEKSSVTMSDYNERVIENIRLNVRKNAMQQRSSVIRLDWTEYAKFDGKFDFIIGSDLIYGGAPVAELYALVKRALSEAGVFYLIIPSQRHFAANFLRIVAEDGHFRTSVEKIEDAKYFVSPLRDADLGFQTYPGLKELTFEVYSFTGQKL